MILGNTIVLTNDLVHMDAKCDALQEAQSVLHDLLAPFEFHLNAIIIRYAQ